MGYTQQYGAADNYSNNEDNDDADNGEQATIDGVIN
mgnify:CR=1 FL=1